jgi:phosphatidylserine/phosphatidylglycerophosphate/cardiolipin synthase-like enzyme
MDDYVGDYGPLIEERAALTEWHRRRKPDDARRFTELTDRIVSRGLQRDLSHKVLRIMTPYDDDTFSEFASQFRTLVRNGYVIRLLTRHTREKWQWERLRENLLGELESNRDRVTVRTYSRYKTYQRITSDTEDRDLDEFGIHAKLQTIGEADEGAALLGSANFMENSYHWNPECGAYTERPRFVAAAIEFFDQVWDLAAADEVDLQNLQQIPDRSYYPSYYT